VLRTSCGDPQVLSDPPGLPDRFSAGVGFTLKRFPIESQVSCNGPLPRIDAECLLEPPCSAGSAMLTTTAIYANAVGPDHRRTDAALVCPSPVCDVHRYFHAEPKVNCPRRFPLHSRLLHLSIGDVVDMTGTSCAGPSLECKNRNGGICAPERGGDLVIEAHETGNDGHVLLTAGCNAHHAPTFA
jgi:hypothetical protein